MGSHFDFNKIRLWSMCGDHKTICSYVVLVHIWRADPFFYFFTSPVRWWWCSCVFAVRLYRFYLQNLYTHKEWRGREERYVFMNFMHQKLFEQTFIYCIVHKHTVTYGNMEGFKLYKVSVLESDFNVPCLCTGMSIVVRVPFEEFFLGRRRVYYMAKEKTLKEKSWLVLAPHYVLRSRRHRNILAFEMNWYALALK